MPSRTVRIDEETHVLVGALSAFLRRPKQSILREAVESLMSAQRQLIDASAVSIIDQLARHGTGSGSTALIELRSLPLSQRIALQRSTLRDLFNTNRCSDVMVYELDDTGAGGRGSVSFLIGFPPNMDWVDRDELRLTVVRMLDAEVGFEERWLIEAGSPARFAKILELGECL